VLVRGTAPPVIYLFLIFHIFLLFPFACSLVSRETEEANSAYGEVAERCGSEFSGVQEDR
jgi:hypothetical protein